MSILVTGGAGYIGSHAVYALIEKGYSVVVIDNLQTGFMEAVHKKASFFKGDIRDGEFLNKVFEKEKIEGVIHFAASSQVGESMKEPLKYFDNNVFGTQSLLRSMLAFNIKSIVFSSSAAVYGEPVQIPISENHITQPINTYGETKLAMEKLMHWTAKAYDLSFISLRYFNVAGADKSGEIGESHIPETHLIPIILQVALGQRQYLEVYGNDYSTIDGTCIRDYIHIEDLVDAHIRALEKLLNGDGNGIYNLGTGTGYSILQMVEAARRVTEHPIPIKIADRRSGDPAALVASNGLAYKQLGWKPNWIDIEDIIESAWKFYKKHPFGFGKGE